MPMLLHPRLYRPEPLEVLPEVLTMKTDDTPWGKPFEFIMFLVESDLYITRKEFFWALDNAGPADRRKLENYAKYPTPFSAFKEAA